MKAKRRQTTAPQMPEPQQVRVARPSSDLSLIDIAIRYAVIADWFESIPAGKNWRVDQEAMDLFSEAESDLRHAVNSYLQRSSLRKQIQSEYIPAHLIKPQLRGSAA